MPTRNIVHIGESYVGSLREPTLRATLALIAAAFFPFGTARAGLLRHPWFLAYGIVIFVLGCLVQWANHAMTFGTR